MGCTQSTTSNSLNGKKARNNMVGGSPRKRRRKSSVLAALHTTSSTNVTSNSGSVVQGEQQGLQRRGSSRSRRQIRVSIVDETVATLRECNDGTGMTQNGGVLNPLGPPPLSSLSLVENGRVHNGRGRTHDGVGDIVSSSAPPPSPLPPQVRPLVFLPPAPTAASINFLAAALQVGGDTPSTSFTSSCHLLSSSTSSTSRTGRGKPQQPTYGDVSSDSVISGSRETTRQEVFTPRKRSDGNVPSATLLQGVLRQVGNADDAKPARECTECASTNEMLQAKSQLAHLSHLLSLREKNEKGRGGGGGSCPSRPEMLNQGTAAVSAQSPEFSLLLLRSLAPSNSSSYVSSSSFEKGDGAASSAGASGELSGSAISSLEGVAPLGRRRNKNSSDILMMTAGKKEKKHHLHPAHSASISGGSSGSRSIPFRGYQAREQQSDSSHEQEQGEEEDGQEEEATGTVQRSVPRTEIIQESTPTTIEGCSATSSLIDNDGSQFTSLDGVSELNSNDSDVTMDQEVDDETPSEFELKKKKHVADDRKKTTSNVMPSGGSINDVFNFDLRSSTRELNFACPSIYVLLETSTPQQRSFWIQMIKTWGESPDRVSVISKERTGVRVTGVVSRWFDQLGFDPGETSALGGKPCGDHNWDQERRSSEADRTPQSLLTLRNLLQNEKVTMCQ